MNRILAFAFLLSVIGCKSGPSVPNGILPPKKMQHVMWDMILADGLISYSYDTMMRKPGKRQEVYSTVLRTHNLSQEEFRKSLQFYQNRPDLLKLVLDSLQQMSLRDTAQIILDTPKLVADTSKAAADSVRASQDSVKVNSQDSVKVNSDTTKAKLDSIKARKARLNKKLRPLKVAPVQ